MPSLCWYMTEKCNLDCHFCYSFKRERHPSTEELFKVGDELLRQGEKEVNLTGGEPLLNRATDKVVERYGDHLALSMTTNGTVRVSADRVRRLRKLHNVCISVDSPVQRTTVEIRGDCANVNRIMENVRRLKASGLNVAINTVVGRSNAHELLELGRLIESILGPAAWRLMEITENANTESLLKSEILQSGEVFAIARELADFYPDLDIDILTAEGLNYGHVIVDTKGDVYIPGVDRYHPLGSVFRDSLRDISDEYGVGKRRFAVGIAAREQMRGPGRGRHAA